MRLELLLSAAAAIFLAAVSEAANILFYLPGKAAFVVTYPWEFFS